MQDMIEKYVDRYCQRIKVLDNDRDFALDCSVRGIEAKKHIMYKLRNGDGCLWLEGKDGRRYEFLIEFDKQDFAYGIYFGCKCILNMDEDISLQVQTCKDEWLHIRPQVIRALNNKFVKKDFSERDLPTTNVNDDTFWPFWYRLAEEEDVSDVAAQATKIIRDVYRDFLKEENYERIMSGAAPESQNSQERKSICTRYTQKAYDEVLARFDSDIYRADARLYYETLIDILEGKGIIRSHRIFEKCWIIDHWFKSEFVELIVKFNDMIRVKQKDRVSWELFTSNFMAKNEKPLDDIRKQKSTNKISAKTEEEINQILKELMRRIKEKN